MAGIAIIKLKEKILKQYKPRAMARIVIIIFKDKKISKQYKPWENVKIGFIIFKDKILSKQYKPLIYAERRNVNKH